jgi:8-oxo-dGTP pyrophosphatase MutT (NUDIX family)
MLYHYTYAERFLSRGLSCYDGQMKQRLEAWGDAQIIQIATCLILNEAGELLLLQRHSEDLGGGQWGTPGGRIENDENARMAALREVYEETGLQLNEMTELGIHEITMPHGAVRMTSFKAHVLRQVKVILDLEEHHAHAWFDPDELLEKENILWGVPTVLRDFGILKPFDEDPTLSDGSRVTLLRRAVND